MIRCCQCPAEREAKLAKNGEPKLPRGWKRFGERVLCQDCKRSTYVLRAVSIPVASCDWGVINVLHREATQQVTSLANWLASMLYLSDARRAPGEAKMPKWTAPYLYPGARAMYPDLDPQCVVSLINTVQSKYRASRLDLWRNAISLPTFRDLPVPINPQAWALVREEERYRFRFRWSCTWHELILRGGHDFRRQIRQLQQILAGEAEAGEAALYHHGKALILKIAAYFPRQVAVGASGIVKARTVPDGFLLASSSGGVQWRLNGDHVQRWIMGFAAQQQRLREDLKAERRFARQMRAGIVERMGQVSDRRHGRVDAWLHEASAQLVGWVERQKAAVLAWDDSYPSQMPSFPWYIFAQRLEDKCRAAGIEFVRASEYAAEKSA